MMFSFVTQLLSYNIYHAVKFLLCSTVNTPCT